LSSSILYTTLHYTDLGISFGASRLPWSTRTSFTKSRHDFREHIQWLTLLITVSSLRCCQNHHGAYSCTMANKGSKQLPEVGTAAAFATLSCERNHTPTLCSVQQTAPTNHLCAHQTALKHTILRSTIALRHTCTQPCIISSVTMSFDLQF